MPSITRRVFNGVTFTALEKISVQFLSVVTFFVVINQITLKDYGLLQLLFSLIGPAVALSLVGMERLIVSDVAVYRAQQSYGVIRKLFTEYFFVVAITFFLALLIAWFLRSIAASHYDIDVNYYYTALIFLTVGQLTMNFTSVMFEAYEKFSYSFGAKFIEAVVRSAIIFSFFYWFGFTLHTIFWAYVIGKLVAAAVSVPLAFSLMVGVRGESPQPSVLLNIVRKHGKWEICSKIIKVASDNAAPWIVHFFVSTEAVALLSFVQKINTTFVSLFPVRGALFPILAHSIEKSRELAIAVASKLKKYLLIVYIVFYALIFFGARTFISHFTPQYIDAVGIVRLTMLHLFVDILTLGQSVVFYSLKQQKTNFKLTAYGVFSTLGSQVLFTYLWGVSGLVVSWLFVGLVAGTYREYILRTKFQYSLLHFKSLVTYDAHDKWVIGQIKARVLRLFGKPAL